MATTTLNNPTDLSAFVVNYFKPPPKDNRESPPASAPDDNENDDGNYSYVEEGIDTQMRMEKEDSVITAFNTFLESSPQVVSQLETGVDVDFDDDTDLALRQFHWISCMQVISLVMLKARVTASYQQLKKC